MADHPHRRSTDDHRLRSMLDSWHLWVVAAYFILFLVVVLGGVTYTRQTSDRAQQRAAAASQYTQCVMSIPFLRRFNRFIRGVKHEHAAVLANAIATRSALTPGTKIYRALNANVARLRKAKAEVQLPPIPVPTKKDCARQARIRPHDVPDSVTTIN